MKQLLFLLLIISSAVIISCKKEKCEAGQGGDIEFTAKLYHHGALIPNDSLRPDTVWVKYNVQDWSNPPAGYDLRIIGEGGEDHVHINGMKCGDYFFYASGWDTSITQVVRGGRKYSADDQSKDINLDISVTE